MGRNVAEVLHKALLRGAPSAVMSGAGISQAFVGRATIASGDATVVVSTALVGSGDVILHGVQDLDGVGVTSHAAIEVKTINPGVQFTLGTANEVALDPGRNTAIMWLLFKASA